MIETLETLEAVGARTAAWRAEGRTVGFVPTMGYLHAGHLSLVEAALARCDRVIASVFVNPTQFGPSEDLAAYPRDLERDRSLLEAAGCHALFTTEPEVMYPPGYRTYVTVEELTQTLCGVSRPIHFRGVATVVLKLFNLVRPTDAFFGEKDRQQLAVIRRMVRDLHVPVRVHGCPISREADGVARSSRNAYLTEAERPRAVALSAGLRAAAAAFAGGERDARALEGLVREALEANGLTEDYVSAVDPETMQAVERAEADTVLAVAAQLGRTRLIDNHVVGEVFPG